MSKFADRRYIEPSPYLTSKLREFYKLDESTAYMRTDDQRAELDRLQREIAELKANEGIF